MRPLPRPVTIAFAALLAFACGKSGGGPGGGGGGGASGVGGIALPEEISALPPRSAAGASALRAGAFLRLGGALVASSLPAGSDYATARTVKWVNERALSRFDILNSIFKAVSQTHYADAENVGAGPYAAIVTAVGEGEEAQTKSLQTWVLSSTMTKGAGGRDVNVVHVWLEEEGHTIPVELRIEAAPTQNPDGSYADYGVWSIAADLGPDASRFFVASAEIGPDGASIVKVHETEGPGAMETRGILHKSGSSGYGKVSFPDWSACRGEPCTDLPTVTVAYTYDARHVKMEIASGAGTAVVAKDRESVIDVVNRYGLYDADGNDVSKSRRFGFPFRHGASGTSYGYYGAWQGRHQLWANGSTLPAGATVTRADRDPRAAAETYTTSPVYRGILVKRTYAPARLSDIQDVVVNTWDFQSFMLQGDGVAWHRCTMSPPPPPGQPGQPPDCEAAPFTSFGSLAVDPGAGGNVNIDSWSGAPGLPPSRTELAVASAQDGLVVKATGAPFAPAIGANVNVNVGGPIWIVYDGTGWKRKQVLSLDPTTHQPTFGAGGTPYAMPDGRELYLNDMGVNYVVRCSGGACTARLELQSVANPANVGTFVSPGTIFTQQSWGQTPSTFRFVTDAAHADFMKLVYVTVGSQDQLAGARAGDAVTTSQWGLTASVDGTQVEFNWDYPNDGGCTSCGVQQFLLDGSGAVVQLDDPIRLAPIALVNGAGETRTYSLQFDGSWVAGLPDLHADLERANGNISAAVQAKNVAIPSGTVVADASDPSRQYVFKQLQVNEYLTTIPDPGGLDLGLAAGLDLSTVPGWHAVAIGPRPAAPEVRYSEGRPVR